MARRKSCSRCGANMCPDKPTGSPAGLQETRTSDARQQSCRAVQRSTCRLLTNFHHMHGDTRANLASVSEGGCMWAYGIQLQWDTRTYKKTVKHRDISHLKNGLRRKYETNAFALHKTLIQYGYNNSQIKTIKGVWQYFFSISRLRRQKQKWKDAWRAGHSQGR